MQFLSCLRNTNILILQKHTSLQHYRYTNLLGDPTFHCSLFHRSWAFLSLWDNLMITQFLNYLCVTGAPKTMWAESGATGHLPCWHHTGATDPILWLQLPQACPTLRGVCSPIALHGEETPYPSQSLTTYPCRLVQWGLWPRSSITPSWRASTPHDTGITWWTISELNHSVKLHVTLTSTCHDTQSLESKHCCHDKIHDIPPCCCENTWHYQNCYSCFWDNHDFVFEGPCFGTRMYMFTGHWPMMNSLNTEYEKCLSTHSVATHIHIHTYRWHSKSHSCVWWKGANLSKSQHYFSFATTILSFPICVIQYKLMVLDIFTFSCM
jgi:hypothetical protein